MLTVDVRCRIDPKTKEQASEVIEAMGLSVSDAIRLFLKRVAADGAIPFELRAPNAKTFYLSHHHLILAMMVLMCKKVLLSMFQCHFYQ